MVFQRAPWKIVAERYPCATCNAGPGESCLQPNGKKATMPHVARTRLASADHWRDPDEVMDERTPDNDRRG